ncbi:MAG: hypothetical protein SNJ56_04875 [Termitinemataceae bacterium]
MDRSGNGNKRADLPVEAALESPDDGIPVLRADLGMTLFPSILGLKAAVQEEVHPRMAEQLSLEAYAALSDPDQGICEKRGGNRHCCRHVPAIPDRVNSQPYHLEPFSIYAEQPGGV